MNLEQAYAALRFDLLVPWWALAGLAAVCVLALLPALLRRASGTLWRALAFAVLIGWLAGPRLVRETRDTQRDIALLAIDQSASMQVNDRAARAEAARKQIQAEAARLPGLELRTIGVPEAGHDGTQLFAAIDRALADIPRSRLSAVIAVTDGQVHDKPNPAPDAPLQVLIPAAGEETDRRLRIIEAPSFGIVGHSVALKLAVDDLGVARPAGPARLTVRRDGEPPETRPVAIGQETTVEVPITRAGPTIVELQADALAGEVSPVNNRAVVTINGVRDRLRVLLVSGQPHQGERTWRRLLKADPSVDLVHFTILRPPERDDLTPAERAGADRLSHPRAVPGQDPRFRPHHPRPVPESRHPAAALYAQHRRLRASGRRAVAERWAGVRRRRQPRADRDRHRAAGQPGIGGGRGVPARSDRARHAAPGDGGLARLARRRPRPTGGLGTGRSRRHRVPCRR